MTMVRAGKTALVAAMALFFTLVVFNNTTDFDSNYQFVRHVLMMDSTFPGNRGMWRAIHAVWVHLAFYVGIIAWEALNAVLCWWGAWAMPAGVAWDGDTVCGGEADWQRGDGGRDAAVVCGVYRGRGRVVSDVAVEDLEWAGCGVPDVCV